MKTFKDLKIGSSVWIVIYSDHTIERQTVVAVRGGDKIRKPLELNKLNKGKGEELENVEGNCDEHVDFKTYYSNRWVFLNIEDAIQATRTKILQDITTYQEAVKAAYAKIHELMEIFMKYPIKYNIELKSKENDS